MGLLRLLLALSVLIEHASPLFGLTFVGGEIAVQSFFAISGFYMAFILNEKYTRENSSWKLFMSNRMLRLMPLYWLIIAAIVLKSGIIYAITNGTNASHLEGFVRYGSEFSLFTWLTLIVSNLFLVGQDLLMFTSLNLSSGVLHWTTAQQTSYPANYGLMLIQPAWSIGTEILFYALAPFLLRKPGWIIRSVLLASLILRLALWTSGLDFDPWTYRFFPTELALFLAGSLAYKLYTVWKDRRVIQRAAPAVLIVLLLMVCFYSVVHFEHQRIFFTISLILSLPFLFIATKNIQADRFIGELSYPVYLVHLFIGSMIAYLPVLNKMEKGWALAGLSILFAVLYNHFLGNRLERIRQGRVS